MNLTTNQTKKGFTVLIAIVVASIVLAIALSIMSITLKQLTLAGVARESEIAFQAANAGVECIRYYDISGSDGNTFDVPGNGGAQGSAASITCLDATVVNDLGAAGSGDEQHFEWTWDNSSVCTDVSIYKFYSESGSEDMDPLITDRDCPEGVECTIVKARGYNAPCNAIQSNKVVERELTVIY
jgi:hypothetical protein